MAKTSGDYEKEFIETAKEKTGKTLDEWMIVIANSGLDKTKVIIEYLKKEYSLNHLQAQLATGIFLNGKKPLYMNEVSLLDNQIIKCEAVLPIYNSLSEFIVKEFPDTQIIPKKTYVSFTAKREFAAINFKPKEIRLGFDLGDLPFNDFIQKSKLTGPMPRISHMVALTDVSEINNKVLDLLNQSYKRVN